MNAQKVHAVLCHIAFHVETGTLACAVSFCTRQYDLYKPQLKTMDFKANTHGLKATKLSW